MSLCKAKNQHDAQCTHTFSSTTILSQYNRIWIYISHFAFYRRFQCANRFLCHAVNCFIEVSPFVNFLDMRMANWNTLTVSFIRLTSHWILSFQWLICRLSIWIWIGRFGFVLEFRNGSCMWYIANKVVNLISNPFVKEPNRLLDQFQNWSQNTWFTMDFRFSWDKRLKIKLPTDAKETFHISKPNKVYFVCLGIG